MNKDIGPEGPPTPEQTKEHTNKELEKARISQALDALLSALQIKNVNEKISDEEYEAKSAIIEKIKGAENPMSQLMVANVEDDISDQEFTLIMNTLEGASTTEQTEEILPDDELVTLTPPPEPSIEITEKERKTLGEKIIKGLNKVGFYIEDRKSAFFGSIFRG